MDTVRAARAYIIWISIALVLISIASCLTYIFMPKVHECQTISTVNVSVIESMFSTKNASRKQWLFAARKCNQINHRLIWQDEWHGYSNTSENILDNTNMFMTIPEKGIYLVYIQVNFQFTKSINPTKEFKIVVIITSNGTKQRIAAAHDSRVVDAQDSQDALLNTFLLMKMHPTSQLSVEVFPSEFVIVQRRPFSSFITIIKWADSW